MTASTARVAAAIALAVCGACTRVAVVETPTAAPRALHESLRGRAELVVNERTAKNVVLFIGDGMGVATVTAARIFDGQSRGSHGEENLLAFERLPHLGLVKTYNSNQQVPDSAGTVTAMLSGVKTRAGVIGVGPGARRGHCVEALAHSVPTLGELAERRRKATGIVTTSRITHATPAGVYAHSAERDWESDRFVPPAAVAAGCRDLAYQLAHFSAGDGLDVVLGGGRREFVGHGAGGERRKPNANLVDEWRARAPGRRFVTTAAELDALPVGAGQVLGLFADSHLTYIAERDAASEEPSLSAMTAKAIELLSRHEQGYFLMVEGARIDHAHHDGKAGFALAETQEFAQAVATALERVDLADTLVLVTADHSHTLTIGGYPTRGNPILGLVVENDAAGEPLAVPVRAADSLPYATLGYQNGPGAAAARGARDVPPQTGVDALQQALVPTLDKEPDGSESLNETHGGEDVALYAAGPWAHLAGGVLEQHAIFHLIMHAFGWPAPSAERTSNSTP